MARGDEMKSTTTASLLVELRRVFSVFELPQQLVSDNDPQFIPPSLRSL